MVVTYPKQTSAARSHLVVAEAVGEEHYGGRNSSSREGVVIVVCIDSSGVVSNGNSYRGITRRLQPLLSYTFCLN